ncbi:hypothetical protein [Zymobacter sp. IVIA_5232.4 C2]|uniref:hypothetical protein n=1 Tax=Zymobacter sp. IVIA_5232.4 C2 TaxID=3394855 RepID=UPI0039C4D0C6
MSIDRNSGYVNILSFLTERVVLGAGIIVGPSYLYHEHIFSKGLWFLLLPMIALGFFITSGSIYNFYREHLLKPSDSSAKKLGYLITLVSILFVAIFSLEVSVAYAYHQAMFPA